MVEQIEQIIEVFCEIDDFCKEYERKLLPGETATPKTTMELSEIMTIAVMYHLSHYREFKWYYMEKVCGEWKEYFPKLVSYNRFVEIMQGISVPLILYLISSGCGKCSGISFVDSTSLDVCDTHRIQSHKVFKDLAKRGKSSTGWFFGFKLHIIINDRGEILSFCITPANVSDKNWKVMSHLTKDLFGKLIGDKGYISSKLSALRGALAGEFKVMQEDNKIKNPVQEILKIKRYNIYNVFEQD